MQNCIYQRILHRLLSTHTLRRAGAIASQSIGASVIAFIHLWNQIIRDLSYNVSFTSGAIPRIWLVTQQSTNLITKGYYNGSTGMYYGMWIFAYTIVSAFIDSGARLCRRQCTSKHALLHLHTLRYSHTLFRVHNIDMQHTCEYCLLQFVIKTSSLWVVHSPKSVYCKV